QIGVPDERSVTDAHVRERSKRLPELPDTLIEARTGTEHGGIELHRLLHLETDLRCWPGAIRLPELVQPRDRKIRHIFAERLVSRAGLDDFRAATRGLAPKHHQVQQGVGAESVRTMHGDAGRLPYRHQTRHYAVGVSVLGTDHLAMVV